MTVAECSHKENGYCWRCFNEAEHATAMKAAARHALLEAVAEAARTFAEQVDWIEGAGPHFDVLLVALAKLDAGGRER